MKPAHLGHNRNFKIPENAVRAVQIEADRRGCSRPLAWCIEQMRKTMDKQV
jgi:hypothetical protein